jgi:hypothetical protein
MGRPHTNRKSRLIWKIKISLEVSWNIEVSVCDVHRSPFNIKSFGERQRLDGFRKVGDQYFSMVVPEQQQRADAELMTAKQKPWKSQVELSSVEARGQL